MITGMAGMGFRIKVFLLSLILSFSLLLGCKKNIDEEVPDRRIQDAFSLIERGYFSEAERIIRSVKMERPNDCYASWGVVFVSINKIVGVVNSILSLLSGLEQVRSAPYVRFMSDIKERSLSDIIAIVSLPILEPTEDIAQNTAVIDLKKCRVKVSLPVTIGSRSEPISVSRFGELEGERKIWGPTEAALIGSLAHTISAVFKFILSINLDINIEKILDLRFNPDIRSIVATGNSFGPQDVLRDFSARQISFLTSAISTNVYDTAHFFANLAYIIDVSPELFKLKPGSERIIDEIAEQFSAGLYLFQRFLEYIDKYSDEKTIIGYRDVGRRGLSADDDVFLNVYSEEEKQGLFMRLGDARFKIDGILTSLLLKPIVNPDYNKRTSELAGRFAKALDVNNPNVKESERWIELESLRNFIPLIEFPNTIKFNPKKFLEGLKRSPEGLRAILPIWSDLNQDGFPEFVIEAESRKLKQTICIRPEERRQSFVVFPSYLAISDIEPERKRIRLVTTRGTYEADFSCYFAQDSRNFGGYFSLSISSAIRIKKLEVRARSIEIRFDVFECNSYDESEEYFVCFNKERGSLIGNITYRPYAYMERSLYPLEKIFSDTKLLELFQGKLLASYAKDAHYTEVSRDNCLEQTWRKQKSYKGHDELTIISCEEKAYSASNTYFSAHSNLDIYSCFYDFSMIYSIFPFYAVRATDSESEGKLVPAFPDILLTRSPLSLDDIKVMFIGRHIMDGERGKRFILENVSMIREALRYRLFVLFFSDPDKLRVQVLREFPLNSYIILGCSAVAPRCFYANDAPHFPSRVLVQGIPINPNIRNDCMFPDGDWSYYYVAFRDPTFFNSIMVNVSRLDKMCAGDPEGWTEPDQYLINKVSADFIQKAVSPITTVLARLVGLVTGRYQNISYGEVCE